MEICPDKYNNYVERVKKYGDALEYVPIGYITEELCKIAVTKTGCALKCVPIKYKTEEIYKIAIQQTGWALGHVIKKYRTEELLFMAQQTSLYNDHILTVLATRIFEIYETMGK